MRLNSDLCDRGVDFPAHEFPVPQFVRIFLSQITAKTVNHYATGIEGPSTSPSCPRKQRGDKDGPPLSESIHHTQFRAVLADRLPPPQTASEASGSRTSSPEDRSRSRCPPRPPRNNPRPNLKPQNARHRSELRTRARNLDPAPGSG